MKCVIMHALFQFDWSFTSKNNPFFLGRWQNLLQLQFHTRSNIRAKAKDVLHKSTLMMRIIVHVRLLEQIYHKGWMTV